jgi:hypothetical protein
MIDLSQFKGNWQQVKTLLPTELARYQEDIAAAEERLTMKGKTGTEAIQEQPGWLAYYGTRKAEAGKLLKYLDARVMSCRSTLIRNYENYSRALSDNMVNKYIDNEPEYLSYLELYLEVKELHESLGEIHAAFVQRGFSLRDWTQLKIVQMQNDVI